MKTQEQLSLSLWHPAAEAWLWKNLILQVKTNILNWHSENKFRKKIQAHFSQCGGFVFQNMPQELFIREWSFINIIPHCWALLHYNDTGVPLSVKEISTVQQLTGGGEGERKETGGGLGQTKGNLNTPLVTAHPRANRGKSITCRIKQKLLH